MSETAFGLSKDYIVCVYTVNWGFAFHVILSKYKGVKSIGLFFCFKTSVLCFVMDICLTVPVDDA